MHDRMPERIFTLLSVATLFLIVLIASAGSANAKTSDIRIADGETKKDVSTSADGDENKENRDGDSGNSNDSDTDDANKEDEQASRGNASGDAVMTSGQMDFYTIRTANNQTYYLVIDHSGAVDNVYLLSTIDENDLEDFVDSGAARNRGVISLPESNSEDDTEEGSTAKTTDTGKKASSEKEKRTEMSKTAGIASLAIIGGVAVAGVIAFVKKRRKAKNEYDYEDENLEYDDGLPTVNEDDD